MLHEVQHPSFWTHILLPLCSMQIGEGWVTSKTQLTLGREENPTRHHCMLYCTYDMLNMFRHFYAHHQELWIIRVLLQRMVCSAWLLVVGGQVQGSRM